MKYGELLTKSWETVWNHKYLIFLGMLAVLGNGGGNGRGGSSAPSDGQPGGGPQPGGLNIPDVCEKGFGPLFRNFGVEGTATVAIIVTLMLGLIVLGFLIWSISRVAEGGLISGVNEIESGRASTLSIAWGAGWARGWRLIGIGLVTAVPGILLLVILGALFYQFLLGENWRILCEAATSNDPSRFMAIMRQSADFWVPVVMVSCVFTVVAWVLGAIRTFADRACMIENTNVLESYGRGWNVLAANFGEVLLLFLIQIGVGLAVGLVLLIPGIFMALCCLLWPLLWALGGAVHAYFSTLWTLAWREWTGAGTPTGETELPAPAV